MTQSISVSIASRSPARDRVEGPAPEVEDLLGVGARHALAVDEVERLVEVLALHLQG